jgi:hypothetical protein
MDKRGQGISINVVIVAAVALLVLVVLSVIFLGRFQIFGAKSVDCVQQGGQCFSGGCPAGQGLRAYTSWVCSGTDAGKTCCVVGA